MLDLSRNFVRENEVQMDFLGLKWQKLVLSLNFRLFFPGGTWIFRPEFEFYVI